MRQSRLINTDELPEGTVLADGLDSAFVGITHDGRAVYDVDLIVDILVADGMSCDEAIEYFEFNIAGAYIGDHTPVYIFHYNPNPKMKKCNTGKKSGKPYGKKKGGKR